MYGLASTKQTFANLISGGLVFESSTHYRALLKKLGGDPQSRVNSCKKSERESKKTSFFVSSKNRLLGWLKQKHMSSSSLSAYDKQNIFTATVSRHAGRLVGVEE